MLSDIGNQKLLIDRAKTAISESSWIVGECASQLIRKYAHGRTDADFSALFGLSPDQFYLRRRVYERFADIRTNFDNLFWGHFAAALEWEDPEDCLKWADDVIANVPEMRAWRRAQRGEDLSE